MDCNVCQKHQTLKGLPGGSFFEDETIFVALFPLLPHEPAHYGHVIIETKRHLTSPAQMSEKEAQAVGLWTQKITAFLEKDLGAEHSYVVRIGDLTPHLHFHVVPRFANTPKEMWGPLLFRWSESKKASAADMIFMTEKFKASLLK